MEVIDKRGQNKPEKEIHGKVAEFHPLNDYILILRGESIDEVGGIKLATAERSLRGTVIAVPNGCTALPIGSTVKHSEYGAEEIHFDDEGQHSYCLVRLMDIRGFYANRA